MRETSLSYRYASLAAHLTAQSNHHHASSMTLPINHSFLNFPARRRPLLLKGSCDTRLCGVHGRGGHAHDVTDQLDEGFVEPQRQHQLIITFMYFDHVMIRLLLKKSFLNLYHHRQRPIRHIKLNCIVMISFPISIMPVSNANDWGTSSSCSHPRPYTFPTMKRAADRLLHLCHHRHHSSVVFAV